MAGPLKEDWQDGPSGPDTDVHAVHMNTIGTVVNQHDATLQNLAPWVTETAPTGTVVGTSDAQILTGKTLALGSNTVSGTTSQFNTALTDGDFATLAGAEVLASKTLTNPTLNNYTEGVVAIGNTGTAKTISLTNGTIQTATLTGNCVFTMPTPTAGKSFVMPLKTGAGGFTATFTGVKWPLGSAPTITATAARLDMFSFLADGTNWYGTATQGYIP